MFVRMITGFVVLAAITGAAAWAVAAEESEGEPKYTIEEIMIKGHKEGLLKKVLEGGKHADAMDLMDLYASLSEQDPPKGDADSWKEKSDALMVAVARVAVKRPDGIAQLKEASNCMACHKVHKGD
mgnify:CR=1 FL=1